MTFCRYFKIQEKYQSAKLKFNKLKFKASNRKCVTQRS